MANRISLSTSFWSKFKKWADEEWNDLFKSNYRNYWDNYLEGLERRKSKYRWKRKWAC